MGLISEAKRHANETQNRSRAKSEEVIELEDVKTGVSITDLGLNDFMMDLLNYVKEHDDLEKTNA